MIFTESTIKISNNVSKMDSTIVLYRGDKNVEIRFTILQSPFKYSNTVATNVIESTNASYGQLVIKTPNDKPPIFSEVSATKEGTVLFTITKEMIDEIEEVGVYTFQIRLMDENKQSRVTIPPVENGIEIKEPIAIEDDNTTNVVGLAKANYAVATLSDTDTPTFDDNGKYNKTNWNDGDIITNASLNKIEDGIYTTNENVTATKKYVDDKVTVKILPVDYNKNCATNVADLEPHSIYMSPNDAKFLYLGYEKLEGSFSGFFLSGNPHGKFIYTGAKDDTKIEVMLEGICYTAYFKTDTVDAHTEKTVFYLTKNNNKEFTPTTDYEPATKKYVDDNTPIKSLPVNPTTKTGAVVDVNNITVSGCYALPKRSDGAHWTNLMMRAMINDGSGKGKSLLLSGYQNYVFHVNVESKKIYCDNLRIVYNIGTTADTTDIRTEPYFLPTTNTKEYTPTNDYNPATKKYVDDNILLEQLPILRVDETNKRIYVNCNNMGTYKKYFVPNKYANAYGFSFIYTNEDKSETEIALIGGAMTRDDFILCARNTNTLFILILGGTDKYTYTKSTKTLEKGLYGYLKIGNTQEYTPTNDYNPATKKYVDDIKTGIDGIKADLGTAQLTTTAKDVKGAVNELNTQYKDIVKQTDLEVERKRIDSFIKLAEGSTTGDAELIDGRIGANGKTYDNIGNAIRNQISDINNILSVDNISITAGIDNSYMSYSTEATKIVSNDKYAISQQIALKKDQTIEFEAQGYDIYVSMLTKVENGNYSMLVQSIDSTVRKYEYTASEDIKVVICYRKENGCPCRTYYKLESLKGTVKEDVKEESKTNYIPMFLKITGIGDSLMSGEHVPDSAIGSAKDIYEHSWLSYISRRNGIECTHYSAGGKTTKGWLDTYKTQFEKDAKSNLYFIALGTNDKNYQNDIPTGSISDDKNAETYVGFYKNIIDIIHTKNPNCAILLCSMYDTNTLSEQYSNIVKQIADLYEYCFYIDFAHNCDGITAKNTGIYAHDSHFTTLGYIHTSYAIERLVNEIIEKNLEFFKWYGYYNNNEN